MASGLKMNMTSPFAIVLIAGLKVKYSNHSLPSCMNACVVPVPRVVEIIRENGVHLHDVCPASDRAEESLNGCRHHMVGDQPETWRNIYPAGHALGVGWGQNDGDPKRDREEEVDVFHCLSVGW